MGVFFSFWVSFSLFLSGLFSRGARPVYPTAWCWGKRPPSRNPTRSRPFPSCWKPRDYRQNPCLLGQPAYNQRDSCNLVIRNLLDDCGHMLAEPSQVASECLDTPPCLAGHDRARPLQRLNPSGGGLQPASSPLLLLAIPSIASARHFATELGFDSSFQDRLESCGMEEHQRTEKGGKTGTDHVF
jgi:hypothetical protein